MESNARARTGRSLDPVRRAAILAGARTVFLRDGFAQGSVDAVAAEAGVGKQTIYRHFRSKEALVVALVEAMCCAPDAPQPQGFGTRQERLRTLLGSLVAALASADSVRLYRAIVAEAERMPSLGRLFWEAGPRRIRAAVAELLAAQDDTNATSEQLIQLALGDAYQELLLGISEPPPEAFERQIDAALALVAKQGS